jgi:superfamily II DNA/RNA helicase
MIDLGFEPQVTQVFEEMGRGDATTSVSGVIVGGVGAGNMSAPRPDDDDDMPAPPARAPPPVGSIVTAPAAPAPATKPAAGSAGAGVAPSGRTTHMFSATFPPLVQKLARTYMHQPATVQVRTA